MSEKISLGQVNRFLLCGVLICAILYFARQVLIPLCFSIFFAMLFTPLSNRMESTGMKRVFSSLVSVLLIIIATAAVVLLIYIESQKLAEKSAQIRQRAEQMVGRVQDYVSKTLNVTVQKQEEMINNQVKGSMSSSGKMIKNFVAGIVGIIGLYVLVLIFTFLFLLQRDKYEAFFLRVFGDESRPDETRKVIAHVSTVAQSYLTGRVMSILIFTALFGTGFLIIGLDGAFLLAFIAGLLTIVPYIGSIVGGLFPFAVAVATHDMGTAIGALTVILIVQGIDNYFIEPYIIGGEVSVSGFFTILILFIGGLLWGVAGMVLFLPMLGVTKIIFDAVPKLKPYGYLIGDQVQQKPSKWLVEKIKKIFGKK
jgi:predicted PurR-regulated permease PerM